MNHREIVNKIYSIKDPLSLHMLAMQLEFMYQENELDIDTMEWLDIRHMLMNMAECECQPVFH